MKPAADYKKILDKAVIIVIIFPLSFSLLCFLLKMISSEKFVFCSKIYDSSYLPLIAIFSCVILVLWCFYGHGLRSPLWGWLPPFVFFKEFGLIGRGLIIFALIGGTLLGLCGQFFHLLGTAF